MNKIVFFLLLTIFSFRAYADSSDSKQILNVPFENFTLIIGGQLQANYTIGPHKIVFCYENNTQTVGIITWPYQGSTQTGSLPIFLKTDPDFQGSFADNSGTITITNNQPQALIVSCLFGF